MYKVAFEVKLKAVWTLFLVVEKRHSEVVCSVFPGVICCCTKYKHIIIVHRFSFQGWAKNVSTLISFLLLFILSLLLSSYWGLYHQLCPTFHAVMQNHQATCLYHCLPPAERRIYQWPYQCLEKEGASSNASCLLWVCEIELRHPNRTRCTSRFGLAQGSCTQPFPELHLCLFFACISLPSYPILFFKVPSNP